MAPEVFTFTLATRDHASGHEVVNYRTSEGDGNAVQPVAPLLLDGLETSTVADPYEGGQRYLVVVHYAEPQGIFGQVFEFHVKDSSTLGLISDIREEHGMSRF